METFQILSDQFSHFQHLFHRWLAIFFIISSYIFDLSSSPHTWGIRGRILSIVFLPVHPHLCWAYPSLHLAAISQNGSSPHTWGILGAAVASCLHLRFIPTYVGHTSPCNPLVGGGSVHPHIRGAYMGRPAKIYVKNGSSPHTWGILQSIERQRFALWFIPTYVGHTRPSRRPRRGAPVHPHLRGAYLLDTRQSFRAAGSSPHTWGIQAGAAINARSRRFIPTYVGHTLLYRANN